MKKSIWYLGFIFVLASCSTNPTPKNATQTIESQAVPLGVELLVNNGFESATSNWIKAGSTGTMTTVSPGRSGGNALSTSGWAWIQQDLAPSNVEAGKIYTLKGYAKAINGATCTMGIAGNGASGQTFNNQVTFTSSAWAQKTITVTPPTGTNSIGVYLSPNNQTCHFDDLSLIATNTYWVSTTGTDNTSCGSVATPCQSIAYSVGRVNTLGSAAPGSTIIVKNGTYNETSKISLGVSGTAAQPITLRAENIVTGVNAAKAVTINYSGPSINTWNQGLIEGRGRNYWIIEGFKLQSVVDNISGTYNGNPYTLSLPRIWTGILLEDADHNTIRYNHTFNTGASGIHLRPATKPGCTTPNDLDSACAIQNTGVKVLNNKVEKTNQGWKNTSTNTFNFEQEALTLWGVENFEVGNNVVTDGTKEGIDIKLGRNGSVYRNKVSGVGKGVPAIGISSFPSVGIYLDGRREPMYNIKIYGNNVSHNTGRGISILTERPRTDIDNSVYNIDIYNNLVHQNDGTGIAIGDRAKNINVYHNTVVQNNKGFMLKTWHSINEGYTHPSVPPKDVVIRNNIFANDTGGGPSNVISGSNFTIDKNLGTYTSSAVLYWNSCGSCVNGSPNSNSLVQVTTANPNPVKFVSLAVGTYFLALQSTSPAINQGSSNTGPAPIDYDGISRTSYGIPDMGAYEFH